MDENSSTKSNLLSSKLPFKASRAALGLILATLFLAGLLIFSTLQNINRAQGMMERFLLDKGETIIRAVEAAMRTSLMHHMGKSDALHTLLTQSSRANDIVFIIIADSQGNILSKTDNSPDINYVRRTQNLTQNPDLPATFIEDETGIFTISKRLRLEPHLTGMPMMNAHKNRILANEHSYDDAIISIGLFTEEFDDARRQDVQHNIFMGAILFLVGSAGLYFLFLYQNVRVTKSTLANMKLYTDNVIESIPVGLVTLDVSDRIVSCNRKMEEILECSLAEIQGKNLHDAFPGCQIQSSDICNKILDHSMDCLTKDGRNIPLKIGGSTLVNNEGDTIGTVLVVRDMSMIRDMEQQLERSRRMAALGKMAAGIAHEIRNPLGTLRGFAHYFGSQEGVTEESKSYADLMVSEVDRLNKNVSGLLQFARPREPHFVPVRLDELISKTAALMENDFANHKLNFHRQCNTDICFAADPDLLLQVLLNLLQNSIHATPSGGEVSLTGNEDEHYIRITVSDNGNGMSAQQREQMFDPFFTTRKTGTGLGLAVSHQIIEQHRGVFEVESTPNVGTTVTIVLPKANNGGG